MSFSNLEYLYEHLPARFRRDDDGLFLKRFLSFFGGELDKADQTLDTFHEQLAPATATEEFIDWWLWSLFGWAWFPVWFTLAQKRAFYHDIARHYARRGTKRGIEEFLLAFGVHARVINEPLFWGEWSWGEDEWFINAPLGIVIQIFPAIGALAEDLSFWGEFAWGDGDALVTPALVPERVDIDGLIRFQWPLGNIIIVEEKVAQ